jgi:hypothetical protein
MVRRDYSQHNPKIFLKFKYGSNLAANNVQSELQKTVRLYIFEVAHMRSKRITSQLQITLLTAK